MASLQSDNEKIVVCTSRKEMLETLEEYKREAQSGWRCINTNALFGRFFLLFEYLWYVNFAHTHTHTLLIHVSTWIELRKVIVLFLLMNTKQAFDRTAFNRIRKILTAIEASSSQLYLKSQDKHRRCSDVHRHTSVRIKP